MKKSLPKIITIWLNINGEGKSLHNPGEDYAHFFTKTKAYKLGNLSPQELKDALEDPNVIVIYIRGGKKFFSEYKKYIFQREGKFYSRTIAADTPGQAKEVFLYEIDWR